MKILIKLVKRLLLVSELNTDIMELDTRKIILKIQKEIEKQEKKKSP